VNQAAAENDDAGKTESARANTGKEVSMRIGTGLGSCFVIPVVWHANWAWGLPLIVVTVVIHALGLGWVNHKGMEVFNRNEDNRHPMAVFAVVISSVILIATALHAAEAGLWAACYQFLGAQPDFKSAMLYSLGAMTTSGSGLHLEDRWRLMGAIEALSGWLLFGLTTAYLFSAIQQGFHIEARSYKRESRVTTHV
jgi:hypothetical protein